jgi:4'-phosphopantetheinyl transferase
MIKVAYCDVSNLNLAEVYESLPENRKKKVDNFRFDKDKKLSAGAYLLLERMLEDENISKPIFRLGEFGKAYISNHEDIHFNLSHSDRLVACAISDREVGIDIENIDPEIDLNIAKLYFYNSEYENIMNSRNPPDEFFRYWVLKESYMKYTGLGFQLNLDEFEIIIDNDEIKLKDDEKDLRFSLFDVETYKLAICCEYDVEKITECNINDNLLK